MPDFFWLMLGILAMLWRFSSDDEARQNRIAHMVDRFCDLAEKGIIQEKDVEELKKFLKK